MVMPLPKVTIRRPWFQLGVDDEARHELSVQCTDVSERSPNLINVRLGHCLFSYQTLYVFASYIQKADAMLKFALLLRRIPFAFTA